MAKIFVVFGATGSQGGVVVSDLLRLGGKYAVRAVTRNPESDKSKKLAEAGLTLVQADMNNLASLKKAVKGAHYIFAVTDFITAGNVQTETKQGLNILEAAKTTLDTLEAYIWSSLPDARTQPIPYQNVVHFNSKNDIAKEIRRSAVGRVLTEVRLGPYYQNFVKAPQDYGPQKQSDGSWVLMLPVNAATRMPFTSVQDLGRLITVIVEDPAKYRTKTVSVVSQ
ncbi:hypothetical protein B0A49_02345 [Cryomyces minteri]|uniref:NmrA-like domain-containing protein n=1 Tax=Cryomyces minteri TaxID=331657 RepID=A0A4U0XP75_9PEZI|nr:hypothetical protein B0A49_02345 [Cryomyces minteri]